MHIFQVFPMPDDFIGTCGLTGGPHISVGQGTSRSTVCRLPFAHLRETQIRKPARAQDLLQAIALQTAQVQRQISRTNLPALVRFGLLIQDISTHHKRRNLSGTKFELPMPLTNISNFLTLAPETIRRLIGSSTEKKILFFENKTVRLLDHHALVHACEVLN